MEKRPGEKGRRERERENAQLEIWNREISTRVRQRRVDARHSRRHSRVPVAASTQPHKPPAKQDKGSQTHEYRANAESLMNPKRMEQALIKKSPTIRFEAAQQFWSIFESFPASLPSLHFTSANRNFNIFFEPVIMNPVSYKSSMLCSDSR